MRARKTIDVATVRELANAMLANSVDDQTQGRTSIAVMLEHLLMDSGNYHGFRYVRRGGESVPYEAMQAGAWYDETRRAYY
jgi:hypothetical protein